MVSWADRGFCWVVSASLVSSGMMLSFCFGFMVCFISVEDARGPLRNIFCGRDRSIQLIYLFR